MSALFLSLNLPTAMTSETCRDSHYVHCSKVVVEFPETGEMG